MPRKFQGGETVIEQVTDLSLFLYDRQLNILGRDIEGRLLAAHSYSFHEIAQLEEIIRGDELINTPNTYGKLYVHNEKFTLVPSQLFDPSQKDLYLSFCADVENGGLEVFYEHISGDNIQVVGGIKKEILGYFDELLPDLEVASGAAFHLAFMLEKLPRSSGAALYLSPIPGGLYLGAMRNEVLQLFNLFRINGEHDLLKYLFAVSKQLGFLQETVDIQVIGDLAHIGCDNRLLRNYFKNVQDTFLENTIIYAEGMQDFAKQTRLLEAYWAK